MPAGWVSDQAGIRLLCGEVWSRKHTCIQPSSPKSPCASVPRFEIGRCGFFVDAREPAAAALLSKEPKAAVVFLWHDEQMAPAFPSDK